MLRPLGPAVLALVLLQAACVDSPPSSPLDDGRGVAAGDASSGSGLGVASGARAETAAAGGPSIAGQSVGGTTAAEASDPGGSGAGAGSAGNFDVKSYLRKWTPGTPGEALPHGVPRGYDWAARSIGGTPSRPGTATTHMNAWGQVYVDTSNAHAANTRVAVKNVKLLALFPQKTAWKTLEATDDIGGGVWTEDFTGTCSGNIDIKSEPDGSRSLVPHDGCNAHYWPQVSFVSIPVVPLAVISIAHTRLVLANTTQADDRDGAAYLIGAGADWRAQDGSCPNDTCTGVGVGRFIRPKKAWRAVVLSTLSSTDIDKLPPPPIDVFKLPDGTWPIE